MSEQQNAIAETMQPRTAPKRRDKSKILPPFNVVLLDDDHHTYEYVIMMLCRLFGHSPEKAYQMACEVDASGRVIVDTTTKERAELKQQQIIAYGRDPLIEQCAGSMTAVIEACPQ